MENLKKSFHTIHIPGLDDEDRELKIYVNLLPLRESESILAEFRNVAQVHIDGEKFFAVVGVTTEFLIPHRTWLNVDDQQARRSGSEL